MENASHSNHFLSFNKDFLGFLASMLCAIHCAALPLILTISTLSGLSFLANHAIEFVFLGISAVIATWSLIPAYRKHHHNYIPLLIVAIGFIFLISSRFIPHGTLEHTLTAIGGFIVAISHIVNWRLLKSCSC